MAPTKPSKGGAKGSSKPRSGAKPSTSSIRPKFKNGSMSKDGVVLSKSATSERKTKRTNNGPIKKKKRVYTDKELGIPALNSIKPAGIQKPHGVKKGKNFVDDKESMMAILAIVQAEKEGNIESKMMRARQMEEIRQARQAEQEKREGERKKKLEGVKDEIRRSKKKGRVSEGDAAPREDGGKSEKKKRSVSFG
ncbi:hypothetical protein MBLNU457_6969t1 [Dothideomycetes sp. NU457]